VTTADWLTALGLVVFSYLVGSLSPSVWLGRAFKGVDVRKVGSGNAGTTNAFRALGVRLGVAVLLLDMLKGIVPVLVARFVLDEPAVTVVVAFACTLGHNYSVFLRGRGGKGVATGAGAALAMMPVPMAIVVALFVILVFTTRIVSIASIVCTIMFPVMAVVFQQPLAYIIGACVMAAAVLWAHRGNLRRLLKRQEPRATFPWNKQPADGGGADGGEPREPGRPDSGPAAN
jgi:acyl phosphate:glycerol-3-phosphate acyltransferase